MEKDKINLTVVQSVDGRPVEIIIREGSALELAHPKNTSISGDFSSVKEFITKNYPLVVELGLVFPGVIQINKENNTILFCDYPHNVYGRNEVIGKLEWNEKLLSLQINKDNSAFTQKQITQLFKNNAMLFKDSESLRALIKTFNEMTLSVETSLTDNKDGKGNVEQNFSRVIKDKKGILPEFIELFCPIFKGTDPIDIKIEVDVDVVNNRPVYSFYCLEMEIIIEKEKEKAISKNVTDFMCNHFTVYNV